MKLVIFGPPGSGKGTYASRLQSRLNVDVIATGDILREIMKEQISLGKKVKEYVEKGRLVPDDIVIEVLQQRIKRPSDKKGFILDGFPRTLQQAQALDQIMKVDAVINLTVPDDIIVERLSTRRICKNCGAVYNTKYLKPRLEGICDICGGPLYQRPDDTPEVIRDRIKVYEQETQPILQYYRGKRIRFVDFRTASIDMPPEVAVEAILKDLSKLGLC